MVDAVVVRSDLERLVEEEVSPAVVSEHAGTSIA